MTNAWLRSRVDPVQHKQMTTWTFNIFWTSVYMNSNGDAPIIGHTHEHFRDTQRTNCKNSRPKQTLGHMHAPEARHARADTCISGQRDARAQAWARRMYPLHAPIDGVQASQSHFDQSL